MKKRTTLAVVAVLVSLSSPMFAQGVHAPDRDRLAATPQSKKVAVEFTTDAGNPSGDVRTGVPLLSKVGKNVGTNMLINSPQVPLPNGLVGRSENTIATDPSGQTLVAGWNDAQGFCGAPFGAPCPAPAVPGLTGYGWSDDGGKTWTDGGTPNPQLQGGLTWITRGDPWFDNGGPGGKTFYMTNMSVPLVDPSAFGLTGLIVHRGSFTGSNFKFDKNAVVIPPTNAGLDTYDKCSIAAGKSGSTKDMVSVAVTNFIEVYGEPFYGFGQIETYTSHDRAATFPKRAIVQADESGPYSTGPAYPGVVNQGAAVAIGETGDIYVTWERGFLSPVYIMGNVYPQIVFAKSTDGGSTFGPRKLVSDISSGAFFPPIGYNRPTSNDFPRIAYDPSYENEDYSTGRLYIAYHDSRIANGGTQAATTGFGNGNTDVYVRYSSDKGDTWSSPILIAGGPTTQFWPAVSVQPDGTVDVIWYQNDDGITDVYYAGSSDGGATFSTPIRVTSASTDWTTVTSNMRPNFGDYIGLASRENRAFASWGDGRPDNHPNSFAAPIAFGTPKDGGEQAFLPTAVTLGQNYPNPFTAGSGATTSIRFSIPTDSPVSLTVYNTMGQAVATIVDEDLSAGSHQVNFNAEKLSGGAYMYKLIAGDHIETKTMLLIK